MPYLRVEGEEGWIQAHWNSAGGLKASDPETERFTNDDEANKLLVGVSRDPWKS